MGYDEAIEAAEVLMDKGLLEAADMMLEVAEIARRSVHEDRMARCLDDPDYDLALSEDKMELRYGRG